MADDEDMNESILYKNAEFRTFSDLEEAIKMYEAQTFCKLYKRDSTTVITAKRNAPNRKLNSRLTYADLKLNCIHGGKAFKSRGTGLRPTIRCVVIS